MTFLQRFCLLLAFVAIVSFAVYPQPELDTSFNFSGRQVTDIPETDEFGRGVLVQADNKVIVFGSSDRQFGMVRYNEDGSVDTAFGTKGLVLTEFQPILFDYAVAGLVQSDGKIVLAGVTSDNAILQSKFAMIRYNIDGSLDDTFGVGGIAITDVEPTYEDAARAMTIQPDGKIILVGRTIGGSVNYQAIVRYNTDGTPDMSFGTGGMVKNSISGNISWANSVTMQADGKILVGGGKHTLPAPPTPTYAHTLFRFNTNGTVDSSFNGNGFFLLNEPNPIPNLVEMTCFRSISVQADGRIVAAGQNGLIIRLTPDGGLDATFDGDGKLITSIPDLTAVRVSSGGKITAIGMAGGDFAVARYNANGSPDVSFSEDGNLRIDFGATINDIAYGFAFDSRGRIVLGGDSGGRFAAARLNALSAANISGRVTNGHVRSVTNVLLTLDDGSGQLRYARTNPFGYYRFSGVPSGPVYTMRAASKQYLIAPRSVQVIDDLANFDLVADPRE